MSEEERGLRYTALVVVVNFGLGSRVLRIGKQQGVTGGTIFIGRGTVQNRLLEFFDMCDIRKEVVLMITEADTGRRAMVEIGKELHMNKAHHGISFSMPISAYMGTGHYEYTASNESRGAEEMKYNVVFVVTDKGRGRLAVEAATSAGARGGTIMNGRGSGIHEQEKLFHMEIEPEKEVVMILTRIAITEDVVKAIRSKLEIDKPGNGIMFVQPVGDAYGLY